jgi:hypothetical protein
MSAIERRLEAIERTRPDVLAERSEQLEKRIDRQFASLEHHLRENDDEVKALRRSILVAAITFATSSTATMLTIYLVFA